MIEFFKNNPNLSLFLVLLAYFIIIQIPSVIIVTKFKNKKIKRELEQARTDAQSNNTKNELTPNQLLSRLQEENRRLLKANDELMKSNQELSAGTSNSADYSRFKNEVDDLKTKISRMQIHEEELEKENKKWEENYRNVEELYLLRDKEKIEILDQLEKATQEKPVKDVMQAEEVNAEISRQILILQNRNIEAEAEIQRINEILGEDFAHVENKPDSDVMNSKILDTKLDQILNVVSKFDKKLDIAVSTKPGKTLKELENLSRQELFAIAKQLQFKGYNKLTNKEIAGLIYGKVNS